MSLNTVYLYGMNARHARFVQEYLIDRNGAAAAIRAGY
jgi:phage terminase small subunit